MQENFLHFIWKFKYFQQTSLSTQRQETLTIKSTGLHNHNAGPDFLNASIAINDIDWYGHIEIHKNASDWKKHKHDNNPAYKNVILHVVWTYDYDIVREDDTIVPTLLLTPLVDHKLIEKFDHLFLEGNTIKCQQLLVDVPRIKRVSMLDRVLFERVERKASDILSLLKNLDRNWEECTYQILTEYFGFKVNNDAFKRLSTLIPLRLLKLHAHIPFQNEALLFGASGLIDQNTITDEYTQKLVREFKFLSHKYNLKGKEMSKVEWNYLRLRPANFPSIRIAQLAAIVTNIPHLCSSFLHINSPDIFYRLMKIPTSSYWHSHYLFNKESTKVIPKYIGKASLQSLLINVIIPLQFAYGLDKELESYTEKAISLLDQIPKENNKITRQWTALGLKNNSSLDSQALLELYNNYCSKSRCLECGMGHHLLTKKNEHMNISS
ncbi:DUF2851 family protein [Flammeovirga pectinis]|uniref:DUF2851 family protein n=1 Tax=Flammeovirga pectinis TaxID=2494373 RepID=A0A3Q9FQC2_9BACT|nr:DUF2851 family protein [Flammeovirga pectinis]AZQ63532.1 DUF2851 family protein [Flammeovirga pectinis]